MKKFEMIPKIYAGDLPQEVEEELMKFNGGLCFHGDGGCVFYIRGDRIDEVPKFLNWMVEIGVWTSEQINLPSYEKFCLENNLNCTGQPYHFKEYYEFLNGRKDCLTVAMTGT